MYDAMWKQLFAQSSRPQLSLQGQIREMLVTAILKGILSPGAAVASSREMAEQLGVGRITVVLAYQQLSDEGFLVSRERRGHFVSDDVLKGSLLKKASDQNNQNNQNIQPSQPTQTISQTDWHKRFCLHPSQQRSIVKPADWQKYPFPFLYGQFDQTLFPTAAWRESCSKTLSVLDIKEWAPDLITRDDASLVEQIRTKILPRRGVWAGAEELIVTVGAQHALYMVADLLVRSKTRVGVEDPGYPDARNIFASRTQKVVPLPIGPDGLIIDESLEQFDYLYTTPSHQCPTGVTMPLAQREKLLDLANRHDLIIIEDDFESENSFEGEPIPALKSLDQNDRVIYVGSLTKSLAPGLRIGFIVAAPQLIQELRALRRLMLRHPSTFTQRTLALFISLGHNDAQLRRIASAQKERHDLLIQALKRYAPHCQVVPVSGGGSCWLRLPDHVDAITLSIEAAKVGVLIEPGDVFFMAEKPPGHYVRLGYQSIPASAIDEGIKRLAQAIDSFNSVQQH
jgi:GntR family transcriptional regulator/MocR family aminotransferase